MILHLLFPLFLALAPHTELRQLRVRASRGGRYFSDHCRLTPLSPYVGERDLATATERFLTASKNPPLFLPTFAPFAPRERLFRSAGVTSLPRVQVRSKTTTLTLSGVWQLDLLSLYTKADFPLTLAFARASSSKGILYLSFTGTLEYGGSREVLRGNEVVGLRLTEDRTQHPITITLHTMERGPLSFYRGPSIPMGQRQQRTLLRWPTFFTTPSPCTLFPEKPWGIRLKAALEGTALSPPKTTKGTKSRYKTHLTQGIFLLRRRKFRAAIAALKQASTEDPKALAPHLWRLKIYRQLRLFNTLLSHIRGLSKRFPTTPGLLDLELSALEGLGRPVLQQLTTRLTRAPWRRELDPLIALELIRRGDSRAGLLRLKQCYQKGSLECLTLLGSYVPKLAQARTLLNTLPSPLVDLLNRHNATPKGTVRSNRFRALVARHRVAVPRNWRGKENRILSDVKVYYREKRGVEHLYRQLLVGIGNPKKLGINRSFSTQYSPANQLFRLLHTRIHKPDGTQTGETAVVTLRPINDTKARIYYDHRAVTITFPSFTARDIVEIAYTITTLPEQRTAPFTGLILQFQEFAPTRFGRMVFYSPKSNPLHVALSRKGWATTKRGLLGDLTYTLFEARKIPGTHVERDMPGWGERIRSVQIGAGLSWRELGKSYTTFIAPQYSEPTALKALANEITRGTSTREAKIQAIHLYVLRHFRYVSLMFGLHSYLPYETSEILSRRFGDCKDMTLLLVLLLKSVGIKAYPAAIRTRGLGKLPKRVPSLAHFDHSIVYLPKEKRWLDTTTKELLYPSFPPHLQGQSALIFTPQGGLLTTTPRNKKEENQENAVTELTLSLGGNTTIKEQIRVQGAPEISWRRLLEGGQGPTKWDHLYRSVGTKRFTTTNLQNRLSPLTVNTTMTLTAFSRRRGRRYYLPLGFHESLLLKGMAPYARRTQDLLIAYPGVYRRTIRLILPRGYCLTAPPRKVSVTTPWIRFNETLSGQRPLQIKREIALLVWRIPAREYSLFAQAVGRIRRRVERQWEVRPCPKP